MAGAWLRRVSIVVAKVTAYGAAVAGIVFGAVSAHRYATTSPRFAIEAVAISGSAHASEDEVRRLMGFAEGDNFFRLNTGAVEERLRAHPWIREAHVSRSFPQGVEIVVLEREALALVDLEHLYLVDRRGEVFKRAMPGDPLDLPVITGLPREEWSDGGARDRLGEVLHALDVYSSGELSRDRPISELHVDATGGLTLYLGDRGMAVKLGRGDLERKLERLGRVVAFAAGRGQELEVVRLDNRSRPGWIVARPSTRAAGTQLTLRAGGGGVAKGG